MRRLFIPILVLLASRGAAQAAQLTPMTSGLSMAPATCGEMGVWNPTTAMCDGMAMSGMSMTMLMMHGNAFLTQIVEQGPRGQSALASPNMFMLDAGRSIGERHFVDVEFMATAERWTLPMRGYPELLQIGESRADGTPFLDDQHPHSSPVMGLTLSDTVRLGAGKDHLKVWFAPRGESTDGPVAFMHRSTGAVNPDAPLGHHIGQDVGHISSTVIGVAGVLGASRLELSTFHGTEPSPTAVDMPMGQPNSYAARFTQTLSSHLYAMASLAFVKNPEPDDLDLDHVWRSSLSAYSTTDLGEGWQLDQTFIWGLINSYDHASALNSFAYETWTRKAATSYWTRAEVLQRTPNELALTGFTDGDSPRWVGAATVGVTRTLANSEHLQLGVGGSLTLDVLPPDDQGTYGGDPVTAKVFLELAGARM